jgi:hypothetical protein
MDSSDVLPIVNPKEKLFNQIDRVLCVDKVKANDGCL